MLLIIALNGGLGNRLRPLLSAISMLENIDYKLRIFWIRNRTCDIDYEEIFEENDKISQISLNEILELQPYVGFKYYNSLNQYLNLFKNNLRFNVDDKSKIDFLINSKENIFIDHNNIIPSSFLNTSLFPKIFKIILKKSIVNEIFKLKCNLNLNKSIFGCHLRGTDVYHVKKINLVIKKINDNKNYKFFICSDMEDLENKVKNNDNVVIHSKNSYVKLQNNKRNWKYNCLRDSESVIEAITDLSLLSFCNIENNDYHSYPVSTFLHVSRLISGWEFCSNE